MTDLRVSEVRLTRVPTWWQDKGFLGGASGVIDNAVGGGGLGVRRTRDGRYTVTFPGHTNATGRVHHHLWPRDEETRRSFEAPVMGALRRQELLP